MQLEVAAVDLIITDLAAFTFHEGPLVLSEPILYGPMFGPLRDSSLFNQVQLDHEIGTLVWPTGADIDPTVLHDWPDHVEAIVRRRKEQYTMPV